MAYKKILFGLNFTIQIVTSNFVKTSAVNIDVTIEILNVTAKPLMGPEP